MSNTIGVYRRARPIVWLEDFARDLRHALRALGRGQGLPWAAAATLAVAIGANVAMFSVLDAVILEPLPYRAPDRLAMLWRDDPSQNLREGRSALADVEQWRSTSKTFEDFATFDAVAMTLTEADGAERIVGAGMSRNLPALLGVEPARGRTFSADETGSRLVLISHRFWQRRFAGSDDAVGATLVLDGLPSEIVGVLPAGFEIGTVDADVWVPNAPALVGEAGRNASGAATWFVIGRLRPTAAFDEARTEMRAISARLVDGLPAAERNRSVAVIPLSQRVVGPESRLALWMLGGAVCLVFLVAAANVTSLSLARGVARAREIAVRAALGASGARLVRQMLAESMLLALSSGLMGTLLAAGGIALIRAFGPVDLTRLDATSLDARAAGWSLALSVLAGILVAVGPAVTLRRESHIGGVEGGRNVSGGKSSTSIRRALVVAELAVAIVLLIGAGLLVRSWEKIVRIEPGFQPQRVLAMRLATPTGLDDPEQRAELFGRVLEQIGGVAGVESAGMIGDLWIDNDRVQPLTVERDDALVSESVRFRRDEVSAHFFGVMGTPLLRGRFFSNEDRSDTTRVAIVNEALAQRSWPEQNPVGRRLKLGAQDSAAPWYTVVGVVADMRRQGLEREPIPQIFEALAQNPPRSMDVFVRTSLDDPLVIADALRAAVHSVERNAPAYAVATLEQQVGSSLAHRRFETSLLTGFSVIALVLAAVGIYGLIGYSIATRTHEIGLRMAVGARAGDIFRLVVGEGLRLCFAGLALGLAGAWWLAQAGASLLFGVAAGDPWTFGTVSLLLTGVAIVACYLPAKRAAALNPVVALRIT